MGGGVCLVKVEALDPPEPEAIFVMNGGEVSGNTAEGSGGGGVMLDGVGIFVMKGGEIRDNDAKGGSGGGVNVYASRFIMWNGAIKDNRAAGSGGGVYLKPFESLASTFAMENGDITGNTAGFGDGKQGDGGGVCLVEDPPSGEEGVYATQFIMERGRINGNTAVGGLGGGVAVLGGYFRMKNGEVVGNTASEDNGIKVSPTGQFIQNGGQIAD
jgi:hypothetical protein